MDQERSFQWNGRVFFGLMLLLFGVLLLMNNADVLDLGPIWRLWPLILVFVGVNTLLDRHSSFEPGINDWRRRTHRRSRGSGGIWLIFVGVWLLVSVNHLWGLHFRETWPILIVGWGVSLLWRSAVHSGKVSLEGVNHGS